jgi:hypothetical protein
VIHQRNQSRTADSDSENLGSNPSSPARSKPLPHKQKSFSRRSNRTNSCVACVAICSPLIPTTSKISRQLRATRVQHNLPIRVPIDTWVSAQRNASCRRRAFVHAAGTVRFLLAGQAGERLARSGQPVIVKPKNPLLQQLDGIRKEIAALRLSSAQRKRGS